MNDEARIPELEPQPAPDYAEMVKALTHCRPLQPYEAANPNLAKALHQLWASPESAAIANAGSKRCLSFFARCPECMACGDRLLCVQVSASRSVVDLYNAVNELGQAMLSHASLMKQATKLITDAMHSMGNDMVRAARKLKKSKNGHGETES